MPNGEEQQPQPNDHAFKFACHVHEYLRQFLQAADQKAVFTLLASSAVLGFVITRLLDTKLHRSPCFWLLGGLASVLLALAGGFAAVSVRPRQNNVTRGLVAWVGIRQRNVAEYVKAVEEADHIQEILTHCHELAGILQRKYDRLKWGIDFFIAGGAATALFLAVVMIGSLNCSK